MRHVIHRLIFALLMLGACGTLKAQHHKHDRIWRPYTQLEVRGSTINWTIQGNLFVPIKQDGDSIVFADVSILSTDDDVAQGSYGFAYRQMLVTDWIFGVHGGLDQRHTGLGNNFTQGVLGFELLGTDWGARWNGYLAEDDPKMMPGSNVARLIGNNIFLQEAEERAYSGTDFEFEKLLWSNRPEPAHAAFTFQEFELWAAAGGFFFDADAQGFEDISGPRARMELRLYDIPFAGPDSRLVVSGQYEYDDVRGSVGTGMLTLRVPFGRGGGWSHGVLCGLNRRMVAPIMRTRDVITQGGMSAPESVAFARSGQAISQVVTIDGTTANPEAVISGAGNDSLVIVDGSAGTVSPGGTIDMQAGQMLMGGGSNVTVVGTTSGATAIFAAPGQRPTIDSGANTTVNASNGSVLSAIDLVNSGNNIRGVLLNNDSDVLLNGITIDTSGLSSTAIELLGASDLLVNSSSIMTSGQFADAVNISGTSGLTIFNSSLSTSGDDAEGIDASGQSELLVLGSTIFTSGSTGSEAVVAADNTQLTMVGNLIGVTGANTTGVWASPTLATDTLAVLLDSNSISSTGHGVSLASALGTLDATVTRNALNAITGANELDVVASGTGTLNLSASQNSLPSLVGTINLDEQAGDINVSQDAPFSGANGIDSRNGIPAANVLIPGNPIDFNEPNPAAPTLP